MATTDQLHALLGTPCPWCGAAPGEHCVLRSQVSRVDTEGGQRRVRPRGISTLDGGCHDARWRSALGCSAPVLGAVVAELHARDLLVGAGAAAGPTDRPW